MSYRINKKELEYLVDQINTDTNNPLEPYTKDKEGKFKSNPGNYHLGFAYGGVKLLQMVNEGGGVRDHLHTGYTTKRKLYVALNSFLSGINHE
tara:strand:+ start:307 stop:585 length:279 start_codon:yes stop_codon:yes gene_type:complete